MSDIKVSIITVCKNSESTIRQTLNSIYNVINNNKNTEYIIQDSLSNDSTLDIINEFSGKISNLQFYSEKDKGLYDGMNKALLRCNGKYVLFLNSDDILLNQFNEFLDYIVKGNNVDFFTAPVVFFKRPKFKIRRIYLSFPYKINPIKRLIYSSTPAHPGFICNLEILKKNKFDLGYKIGADYNQICKIVSNFKYKRKVFNKPIIAMAMGGRSNTIKGLKNNILEVKKINYKLKFKENLYVRYLRNVLQHILPIFLWQKLNLKKISKELEINAKIKINK